MDSSHTGKLLSLYQNTERSRALQIFASDAFDLRDGAEEIFEKCNVHTAEELMSVILMIHAFGNSRYVEFLFEIGLRRSILTKKDIINLYLTQSEHAREYGPFLTFETMARISQFAFPVKKGEGTITPTSWITQEEMMVLANQVISISHKDLYMIFQQWFYRTDDEIPLSREFFEYWYKKTGETFSDVDGKIASLLVIAYQKKYPDAVSLEGVLDRFKKLCRREPESHGIFRYMSLCFWIAGDIVEHKQKVIDAWVTSIISMLHGGKSLFSGAQFSLELFLSESNIDTDSKKRGITKIQQAADEIAKEYSNLTLHAEKLVSGL